jgi:hypothetical protein
VRVDRLRLLGVRNLRAEEIELGGLTLLWGPNGAGKTSVLEAICLALSGRSCRTRRDREVVGFGEALARVEADVSADDESRTFLWSATRAGDRRHQVDGSPHGAEHEGLRPRMAIFLPDRLAVVKGPPGPRRDHLDRLAAAIWPARNGARRRYAAALAQRNALLARIRAGVAGASSLDAWDAELAVTGLELMTNRAAAAAQAAPHFAAAAAELGLVPASLDYRPRSRAGDLHRPELPRRTRGAPQQDVAEGPGRALGEEDQGAAGEITHHVHHDRGDDGVRRAHQIGHVLQRADVDLGHGDHDRAVGHLRQRGGGVAGPDVGHFAQGVELELLEVSHVFHGPSYTSAAASRMSAGEPSARMVAPPTNGGIPRGASNGSTTMSC